MRLPKDVLGRIMYFRVRLMIRDRERAVHEGQTCAFGFETDRGHMYHDLGGQGYILLRMAGSEKAVRVGSQHMRDGISRFWLSHRSRGVLK